VDGAGERVYFWVRKATRSAIWEALSVFPKGGMTPFGKPGTT
jgi:hypothetical protein